MKINRDNYEAYFLDYHEGQLSPDSMEEVREFVNQNPDLHTVFNEFDSVSLIADQNIVFDKKPSLKKNPIYATAQVNELNYEEYLISETEGLLSAGQILALDEFILVNPHIEKDRRLFAMTHLTPDDKVTFINKESVKQKAIAVGSINAGTYETFMAREAEGDLNADEKHQLNEFMKFNPQLEKDRKLYASTILTNDTSIVFENKNQLKHAVIIPLKRIVYYAVSVAASLTLIFSLYYLLNSNTAQNNVAQQVKIKSSASNINKGADHNNMINQVADKSTRETDAIGDNGKSNTILASNIFQPEIHKDNTVSTINRNPVELIQNRSANEITTRSYVDPQFTFIRISQMYMNENLELYYNLKLAQEMEYAALNAKDNNPAKTIFSSITGKIGDALAINRNEPPKSERKDFSLWTVAELGVKTFNTITSSELELNLKKDDEGKVVSYDLEGGIIDIEREIQK